MAITVIYKSSNKTKTIGKSAGSGPSSEAPAPITQGSLTPFIDKISVVVTPASEEHAYQINSSIWTQFEDKSVFQTASKSAAQSGGFNVAKLIALTSTPARPLLQYQYV